MSKARIIHEKTSFSMFTFIAIAVMSLFLIQAIGFAFISLGIPVWLAFLIVPGSLIGSIINIPLYTIKSDTEPCTEQEYLQHWGIRYQVFHNDCPGETEISINVGGAILPIVVSGYLILTNIASILHIIAATTIVALVVYKIARVEPNVGIITPGLVPPFVAVIATWLVIFLISSVANMYPIAYISGTLGTLIGADIMNLGHLSQLRTSKASIGGAGAWDGVFLTGILAVFLL